MKGDCETTTLESVACTWDTPENCVMIKNLTQDAELLHYPLTAVQKEHQFLFLSDFNDSLFVKYQGGFAMPVGKIPTKKCSSNAYQFLIDNTSYVSYTSLIFSEVNDRLVGAQPWRSVGADEIEFKLHLGTKLDFIMYFNTRQRRLSEMTLSELRCEFERTHLLTILM